MTRKVIIATNWASRTRRDRVFHTSADCAAVRNSKNVREIDRDNLPDNYNECKKPKCGNIKNPIETHDPRRVTRQLEKASPEDFGLSPIGGKR